MLNYEGVIDEIERVDQTDIQRAKSYLDSLAKPPGSLGRLEEIAAKIYAISKEKKLSIAKRCMIVCAADNGVVEEGVSCTPQSVTLMQTINIARGITGVGVLARAYKSDILVVDLGVNAKFKEPGVLDKKIRMSTENFYKKPAMKREEAIKAVNIGIKLAVEAKEKGYQILGVGEMGIGNTTTSSAVLAALLGFKSEQVEQVVGRGGGLEDSDYLHKIKVIQTAIEKHQPLKEDPIDVLSKVGGLDLAGMTGVFLGAAYAKIPVVVDGFISAVAALCAKRLCKQSYDYMIGSHESYEKGYCLAMEELGLSSSLSLGMRLGEGSGCPIMFSVIDGALMVYNEMATFEEASINDSYLDKIKELGEKAF